MGVNMLGERGDSRMFFKNRVMSRLAACMVCRETETLWVSVVHPGDEPH